MLTQKQRDYAKASRQQIAGQRQQIKKEIQEHQDQIAALKLQLNDLDDHEGVFTRSALAADIAAYDKAHGDPA